VEIFVADILRDVCRIFLQYVKNIYNGLQEICLFFSLKLFGYTVIQPYGVIHIFGMNPEYIFLFMLNGQMIKIFKRAKGMMISSGDCCRK